MKAGVADKAKDAFTIGGIQPGDLEESAEIDTDISTHTAIPYAHHTKTISFTDLTDTATDTQIPNDITINYAKDADKVDGKHASEFADTHSLDAVDGSPVDVVYVKGNGNVGIGINSPVWELDVLGTISVTKFFGAQKDNILPLQDCIS